MTIFTSYLIDQIFTMKFYAWIETTQQILVVNFIEIRDQICQSFFQFRIIKPLAKFFELLSVLLFVLAYGSSYAW